MLTNSLLNGLYMYMKNAIVLGHYIVIAGTENGIALDTRFYSWLPLSKNWLKHCLPHQLL